MLSLGTLFVCRHCSYEENFWSEDIELSIPEALTDRITLRLSSPLNSITNNSISARQLRWPCVNPSQFQARCSSVHKDRLMFLRVIIQRILLVHLAWLVTVSHRPLPAPRSFFFQTPSLPFLRQKESQNRKEQDSQRHSNSCSNRRHFMPMVALLHRHDTRTDRLYRLRPSRDTGACCCRCSTRGGWTRYGGIWSRRSTRGSCTG